MRKPAAVLGSALFFVVVPCVLAGLVPWWITHWQFRPAFLGTGLTRIAGIALILAGLPGLVDSFARFALQGVGTLHRSRQPRSSYDEPTLQRTFGAEYDAYRASVPRWMPRMTPWRKA